MSHIYVTFSEKMLLFFGDFMDSKNYVKTQFEYPGRLLCPDIICLHTVNHEPLTGTRFRGRGGQLEKINIYFEFS